jgi:hypothetical protein
MTAMRWVVLLLTVLGLAAGCDSNGPPIRIIVPRDFRGEFRIVETPEGRDVLLRNGEYVYTIPRSGQLLVKSFAPFAQWHTESITFDDGTPVNHYDHPAHARTDELAVFGGGITVGTDYPHPTQRYFVGRTSEATQWVK